MRREMMARKAEKPTTTSEQLEELTPAELTAISGGYGYGGGMPFYGNLPYGGFRYGGFRYGGGIPFYHRPRYQRCYFPY